MISAVVLAAGLSRRMGQLKLLLPWGQGSVIGHIVTTLEASEITEIVVVTGFRTGEVAAAIKGTRARIVHNPHYDEGGMLSSAQVGLRALGEQVTGALLCLGDQPQIEADTIKVILKQAEDTGFDRVLIPSYGMRAGHPIFLPRSAWDCVLSTKTSLREGMHEMSGKTTYVEVDTASILADLDTPEEYERAWKGSTTA